MKDPVLGDVKRASDGELARAAAGGNIRALGALYDRYAEVVYRVAFGFTLSADEAEDIVQDVFIGMPGRLSNLEDPDSVAAWLRRVAARTALSRLRTDRRQRLLRERNLHPAIRELDRSQDSCEAEVRVELERLLAVLPPKLRAVVVLKELEQYAHEEVATALGITVGASKVRLHRAMRVLRRHVKNRRNRDTSS